MEFTLTDQQTEPSPRTPRRSEYFAPLFVVLLIVLGLGWYLVRVWERVDSRPPVEERLNLQFPNGAEAR